jgi:hypothetical protein
VSHSSQTAAAKTPPSSSANLAKASASEA